MAEIQVDTKKLNECGNEIMKLANELNEELDMLFKRIENIPTVTHEWVGDSANKFAALSKIDKVQYYTLKDALYNHGKYLVESANLLDSTIQAVKGKIS